jgi:hypothetical protein
VPLALAGLSGWACQGRAQDLSQGIAAWAEATVGKSSVRWVGQRVPSPTPTARPASVAAFDSESWPLRVHLTGALTPARLELARATLAYGEQVYGLLAASQLFSPRSAAGLGEPVRRDLYLVDAGANGGACDDTEVVSDLDACSAFALVAARAPAALRMACVAEALIDAQLFELDPAEEETVRKASARYFARLVSGEGCTEEDAPSQLTRDETGVLRDPDKLARWLSALGARQDHNRGVFLENMWQFARQKTWEGSGLRGSPDLFEAIAKALELSHDKLEEIAGELANRSALQAAAVVTAQTTRASWDRLPAHLPASAPLSVLDSSYQWIDLAGAHPGERLTIWTRGEYGVRWVLSATRLDAEGGVLATVNAPVHKNPDTELTLELDGATRYVLASITDLGSGLPDADVEPRPEFARSARMIVARSRPSP